MLIKIYSFEKKKYIQTMNRFILNREDIEKTVTLHRSDNDPLVTTP